MARRSGRNLDTRQELGNVDIGTSQCSGTKATKRRYGIVQVQVGGRALIIMECVRIP